MDVIALTETNTAEHSAAPKKVRKEKSRNASPAGAARRKIERFPDKFVNPVFSCFCNGIFNNAFITWFSLIQHLVTVNRSVPAAAY